jgi:hypothetical protein
MNYKTKWQKIYSRNHTLVNTVVFGLYSSSGNIFILLIQHFLDN